MRPLRLNLKHNSLFSPLGRLPLCDWRRNTRLLRPADCLSRARSLFWGEIEPSGSLTSNQRPEGRAFYTVVDEVRERERAQPVGSWPRPTSCIGWLGFRVVAGRRGHLEWRVSLEEEDCRSDGRMERERQRDRNRELLAEFKGQIFLYLSHCVCVRAAWLPMRRL